MKYRIACLALCSAFAVSSSFAQNAQSPNPPQPDTQSTRQVPEWQKRDLALVAILRDVQHGDAAAMRRLEEVLSEIKQAPQSRTPLEYLQLIAVYYLPRYGVENSFSMIVAEQVLGWYDALRFASESGRAELVNNVGFFKLPYRVSGSGAALAKFLKEQPEKAAQAFSRGIAIAEKFRETPTYDRHWAESFGLEQLICADHGKCEHPEGVPGDQWDTAWAQAKGRVASYYLIGKTSAAAGEQQSGAPDPKN